MKYKDHTGLQYNWLTVIKQVENDSRGNTVWLCKCECGNFKRYRVDVLQKAKSCGKCQPSINHPAAYKSWMNARSRCRDTNHPKYHRYGGRGITFTEAWDDFKIFIKDMGDPPWDDLYKESYQLERIDNDKGYCKENCKWATRLEQSNNRNNKVL